MKLFYREKIYESIYKSSEKIVKNQNPLKLHFTCFCIIDFGVGTYLKCIHFVSNIIYR